MNDFRMTNAVWGALVALVLAPHATADQPPVAAEPLGLDDGYDWASRANQTHLVVDATPLYALVDATDVVTPYIDLEITGIVPWRSYDLALGPIKRAVHANGAGEGVAWNVFNEPGVWMLTDGVSGEPVSMISVVTSGAPAAVNPADGGSTDGGPWYCPWCGGTSYQPPEPVYSEPLETGMVLEQGAYSFTPTATVRIENCWKHKVSVDAKASGGIAAGGNSAGAKYTYTSTDCVTIASQGTPREYRRGHQFQKDWYEDNSWKIYSVGESGVRTILDADVNWSPSPHGFDVVVDPGPEPTVFTRQETSELGVYFTVGVKVFDVGVGVTVESMPGSEATIEVELMPTERSTYRILFVDDRQGDTSGLIAAVWRIA